jgi:hypothetical protein
VLMVLLDRRGRVEGSTEASGVTDDALTASEPVR